MHSAPFSEIAAHACGLIAGITAYLIAKKFTFDHEFCLKIGKVFSILFNTIVGGKINVLMKDFFSLIVIRPISAFLGVKLLAYVVQSGGW